MIVLVLMVTLVLASTEPQCVHDRSSLAVLLSGTVAALQLGGWQGRLGEPPTVSPPKSCGENKDLGLSECLNELTIQAGRQLAATFGVNVSSGSPDCLSAEAQAALVAALSFAADSPNMSAFVGSLSFPLPSPLRYALDIVTDPTRRCEGYSHLYDATGQRRFTFRARAHGQSLPSPPALPDTAISQFYSNGATPLGLSLVDWQEPELPVADYGPYPLQRFLAGLTGPASLLLPNVTDMSLAHRTGILMHTGKWADWSPPSFMPDSHGCVHVWPSEAAALTAALYDLGATVRPNSGGASGPYPYIPQGIALVRTGSDDELICPA
mmetsp:Transcript_8741/g.27887  ORF Transcript_8741/g.27887 Transcript_8741/m.27887 type:complete len:324 (-) Transcript_8741:1433-2404(-)